MVFTSSRVRGPAVKPSFTDNANDGVDLHFISPFCRLPRFRADLKEAVQSGSASYASRLVDIVYLYYRYALGFCLLLL